jgi:hypothetical protein
MRRAPACLAVIALSLGISVAGPGAGVTVVTRAPSALGVRLAEASGLLRVTYDDGAHRFVWENLTPDAAGMVRLTDDQHLRPDYRLQCESRTSTSDPVVFDDLTKGRIVGKSRLPCGVPVSTFGGPGYLVPGVSELTRDKYGNFWVYLDHPPYAVLKYDAAFTYQFALLLPGPALAQDVDGEGNLYLLHEGNWLSKHGPRGEALNAWELPFGRDRGGFLSASGMVIDRELGFIYLADEVLSRVQRFDLDLKLSPIAQIAWGWIGREDLAYTRAGQYDPDTMYYQLDRPRQVRLDGRGRLYVSSEHYITQFDLATGRQLSFGKFPALGWGGTFSDPPTSTSAGLDGHWQQHYLAGVDRAGRIYVADRANRQVVDPRLQVFSPDGKLERVLTWNTALQEAQGSRVYVTAVSGLACDGDRVWLVDAAGRVYESRGLTEGGKLSLGPGAAGRQFDLSQVEEAKLSVESQESRVRHRSEGRVLAPVSAEAGTGNCEREGISALRSGEYSLWAPVRLGEPFRVTLLDATGQPIPTDSYAIEYEETPGLFGTRYDFFRVLNRSGATWQDVRFVAETLE